MNGRREKTVVTATGAALAAVCVALNFVASLHVVRLDVVFYLLAGALVYFAAVRFGPGAGGAIYAVSAILSFLIVPDKVWLLFFIGVFGPAAVCQALLERALNGKAESGVRQWRWPAAVLTVIIFIVLFYLFGFVASYGGGFIPLIGLPEAGMPGNLILAMGFAAFSAVIAYIVNHGLYAALSRRVGRMPEGKVTDGAGQGGKGSSARGCIVLPKLYDEED